MRTRARRDYSSNAQSGLGRHKTILRLRKLACLVVVTCTLSSFSKVIRTLDCSQDFQKSSLQAVTGSMYTIAHLFDEFKEIVFGVLAPIPLKSRSALCDVSFLVCRATRLSCVRKRFL